MVGVMLTAGQTGVMVKLRVPVHPFASVAVMTTVALAVLVGVPLSTPVLVLNVIHEASPLALSTTGVALLPEALIVAL